MAEVSKDELHELIDAAKSIAQTHVDVSGLLGVQHPLYLGVADLHAVLLENSPPAVKLSWDGDGELAVKCTQTGEVFATLSASF